MKAMTTLRQLLANRRNSEKSTGPRTPGGRAVASRNATTHGMTAETVAVEDQQEQLRERMVDWEAELRPEGAYQRWLAEQAVAASLRVDLCRQHEDAWRFRQSRRAGACWDADRRLEVEWLAQELPKRPALVALQLRQTPQGCDWMLSRWRALAESLRGTVVASPSTHGATPTP